jgi:hypothetical protein
METHKSVYDTRSFHEIERSANEIWIILLIP